MTSNPQSPPHDVLEAFELCEQFADYLELPVDYVWQEFGDPGTLSCEELMEIFSQYWAWKSTFGIAIPWNNGDGR